MNNLKFLFTSFICLSLIKCGSIDKNKIKFNEDSVTISIASLNNISCKSDDPNIICFAFLNKFQDSIIVLRNDEKVLNFRRNDTLNYKEMDHNEIFKTFMLDSVNESNKIDILLLNEKRKISFHLKKNKSFYLISRYNNYWYVTI